VPKPPVCLTTVKTFARCHPILTKLGTMVKLCLTKLDMNGG